MLDRSNFYTGLSITEPTNFQTRLMEELGFYLGLRGIVLRTRPLDTHFEEGVKALLVEAPRALKDLAYAEVYSGVSGGYTLPSYSPINTELATWETAEALAQKYSSNWRILDDDVKAELILNVFLLLGSSLDKPSTMLLYNFPAEKEATELEERVLTHAVALARGENIKTFNFGKASVANKMLDKINQDYLTGL